MSGNKIILGGIIITCFITALALNNLVPNLVLALLVFVLGIAVTFFAALSRNRLQLLSETEQAWNKSAAVLESSLTLDTVEKMAEGIRQAAYYEQVVVIPVSDGWNRILRQTDDEDIWELSNSIMVKNQSVLKAQRGRQPELFKDHKDEVADFVGFPLCYKEETIGVLYLLNYIGNEKYQSFYERHIYYMHKQLNVLLAVWKDHFEKREQDKELLDMISAIWDSKQPLLVGHSRRVAQIALLIGRNLHLPKEEAELLYKSALLHDIGKVVGRAGLSDLDGALVTEEAEVIDYEEIGAALFPDTEEWKVIRSAIYSHGEYYNGSGRPQGLKDTAIPLYARIIAVADYYDALKCIPTNNEQVDEQPFHQDVLNTLKKGIGTYFDPLVIIALEDVPAQELNAIYD